MSDVMGLKQMSKGDKAILTGFSENGSAYRRKLLSMGLTRGWRSSSSRQPRWVIR